MRAGPFCRGVHPGPWRLLAAALLAILAPLVLSQKAAAETQAERGYRLLLTMPLAPPLLTEAEYFDLWQVWPEPARSAAEAASAEERRQMLLSRYGFQETADRPGPIPQQFTPDGKGNLSDNCLSCHGGPVAGTPVRGLGNSLIDLASFTEDLAGLRAMRGTPSPEWPAGVPFAPEVPVRGLNNAWGGAIAFLLVRDGNADRTETLQFPAPTPGQMLLPIRTPAYWLSRRKSRYYADAFIEKSHRDIMQFVATFAVSGAEIRDLEAPFRDIYAWINSVEPPPYPGPVDAALAQRGRLIYLRDCLSCHGSGASYPERVIPLAEIGTDPVRMEMPRDFKLHLGNGWFGENGRTPLYPDTGGYLAPPLDGVWATAPYLHNGAVPTMWHLLTPEARPAIWSRSDDGYDHERLGVETTAHESVPEGISAWARRRYFQTGLRGLGNQGHAYPPAGLSEPDKQALIEYLKTL